MQIRAALYIENGLYLEFYVLHKQTELPGGLEIQLNVVSCLECMKPWVHSLVPHFSNPSLQPQHYTSQRPGISRAGITCTNHHTRLWINKNRSSHKTQDQCYYSWHKELEVSRRNFLVQREECGSAKSPTHGLHLLKQARTPWYFLFAGNLKPKKCIKFALRQILCQVTRIANCETEQCNCGTANNICWPKISTSVHIEVTTTRV